MRQNISIYKVWSKILAFPVWIKRRIGGAINCFWGRHDFSPWNYIEAATCKAMRRCLRCKLPVTDVVHEWGEWEGRICFPKRECKRCSVTENAVRHQFTDWLPSNGSSCYRTCKNCGYSESEPH